MLLVRPDDSQHLPLADLRTWPPAKRLHHSARRCAQFQVHLHRFQNCHDLPFYHSLTDIHRHAHQQAWQRSAYLARGGGTWLVLFPSVPLPPPLQTGPVGAPIHYHTALTTFYLLDVGLMRAMIDQ